MDQLGEVVLKWTSGYNNSSVYFIGDVVCFLNVNTVKFYDLNTHQASYLQTPGDGINNLAVNTLNGFLAFTEEGIDAKIFVYNVTSLDQPFISFKSGVGLGYSCLSFANNGSILASCSSIPDVQLTLWNFIEGRQLCSIAMRVELTLLDFNPMNWRHLSGVNKSGCFKLWKIEEINEEFLMQDQNIQLPLSNGTFGLEVVGDELHEHNRIDANCKVVSQCWAPENHLYIGCANNMLFYLDIETGYVTIVYKELNDFQKEQKFLHLQLHVSGLFAVGQDQQIRCFNIAKDQMKLLRERKLSSGEILSMRFSNDYSLLGIGNNEGNISILNTEDLSCVEVIKESFGSIVGIASLSKSNNYYVTCSQNGLLEVWLIEDGTSHSSLKLDCEICCLASSISSSTLFLGTKHGSVIVVDLIDINKPRCVQEKCLYRTPLLKLSVDDRGAILIAGSSDSHLFLMDAKPSSFLKVLGHTEVTGTISCLSCQYITEHSVWKVLVGLCLVEQSHACKQMVEMEINEELFKTPDSFYVDDTLLLKDVSISKQTYLLKSCVYDVCAVSKDIAIGISHQDKRIAKFALSQFQSLSTNHVMDAVQTYDGHAMNGGSIALSCHGKWIATCSADGYFALRTLDDMKTPVIIQGGNYRSGGIRLVAFTMDAQSLLTVSETGHVSCWQWKHSVMGESKFLEAVTASRALVGLIKNTRDKEDLWIGKRETICVSRNEKTWLEGIIEKSHAKEDERYSSQKNDLRDRINDLKHQIHVLIRENEEANDMEKLDLQEFNLDIEEYKRIVHERKEMLKEMRNKAELQNTAQLYLRHLIKQECWDDMQVKGREIRSFNGNTSVANFPMRHRSKEELEELELTTSQRSLEEIDAGLRKTLLPKECAGYQPITANVESEERDGKVESSTFGSLASTLVDVNEMLQNQFTLRTRNQKKNQIVLIKDCIHKIKCQFNKQFNDVMNFKLQEMRRMGERNERIKKIMKDISVDDELVQLALDVCENPEDFLKVHFSEVTVEKYISEEERIRIEQERTLEEERRLAENADNLRGRALDVMMAGKLETNLEDELKEELVPPAFVVEKPAHEWSEEETKLAKEFEKKKQTLEEEKEKLRKSLETEMKKLQNVNVESINGFNERIDQLFQCKTKCDMVVAQEELKIVRLIASILNHEMLLEEEARLMSKLERKKEERQNHSSYLVQIKTEVEAFREVYEILLADDKTMDKTLRKEFTELDQFTVETLYKLFKKRPRLQRTLKASVEKQYNGPFELRPSTSRVASVAAKNLENAMLELDAFDNAPEGVTWEVWGRLVTLRRIKVGKEQQIKAKALVLAQMNSFLQTAVEKDEELKSSIEKVLHDLQRLREDRFRSNMDLEVQLILKQGQIEIGSNDFVPDTSDSILVHRSVVEELNSVIKTLGHSKLASMHEIKDFRKGIHELAWKLREMFMRAEDLQTTAQDLQLLRVTKELQLYLSDGDQKQSKQQEISALEKTFEMHKKMHQNNLKDRKRVIYKLRQQIKDKSNENLKLDEDLEVVAIATAERRLINDGNNGLEEKINREERMHNLRKRRKLVDLSKAQALEIELLRKEVERLRMRTFPALAHIEPK